MAQYDDKRTRRMMDTNNARGQQLYENASNYLGAQGQQFQGDYGRAMEADTGMRNQALGGFTNFANTGGFSPNDITAMRARGTSPIRAAYANAQRNIGRMGGNMPGRATMMGRMAREQGQAASDATMGVDAGIAQMRQQGKLAGNQGIANLYGTTPGNTAMQAGNVLQNTQQGLQLHNMEQNRMQDILNTQLGLTSAPGTMDKYLQWGNQGMDMMTKGKNIFSVPTKPTGTVP